MVMKIAAAAAAIVLAGMLTAYTTQSASAAKYNKDCTGTWQSSQGGQCVNLSHANPNRERPDYYSSFYKKHKAKKSSSEPKQ